MSSAITPGKALLSLVGLSTSTSCFIADWNETHIYNKRWTPHAKFHNGQTMSMGMGLGLATIYYTWKPIQSKESLITACIFGSLYWITTLSAYFYPGSLATDPEFGEGFPQKWVCLGQFILIGAAYGLESGRMMGLKSS